MIRRLALCLTLLPGVAIARQVHQTPPVPAPERPPEAGTLTPPAMCEAAIAPAEAEANMPARVLTATALRESGRVDPAAGRARPCPWTINYEGPGHFYASRDEAVA